MVRSRILCSCFAIAVAFTTADYFFCATATAQSLQTNPGSVPVLKGTYVFTEVINCVRAQGTLFQTTGSLSLDPGTGTFKLDAFAAEGDPLTLDHVKQRGTYSNSGATITFDSTTYKVTYGKLEKGIATYLSFIAADGGCASQITLSRK